MAVGFQLVYVWFMNTKDILRISILAIFLAGCMGDDDSTDDNGSGGGGPTPTTDQTPPTVSITNPGDGATVGSTVVLTVTASDASNIANVELFDNGTSIGTDDTAPYEFNWSPTVGEHTLTARATDGSPAANTAESSINVTREASIPATGWNDADFSTIVEVGPGMLYTELHDVPWDTISADTLIKVFWRAEPYRSKFAINTSGTQSSPVVLAGIEDAGRKPIIDGQNAVSPAGLGFSNEQRSVIKIGGADYPAGQTASWVYIDNLVIRGGDSSNTFTDSRGATQSYSSNAASVHVSVGSNLFVQNSEITGSGNGIFSGFQSSNVTIRQNYIHSNGVVGQGQRHNTYTESDGIVYEFNRFGPLRNGAGGENLKDRSAGSIIRYNWIEGGNRQLDLVDSDHSELYNDPAYATTFVYGNVLIEPEGDGNRNMVHYGGDLTGRQGTYRKGTLHFYHNTVVTRRTDVTTVFGPSSTDENIDARNNIFYSSTSGSNIAITSGSGITDLTNNWLPTGWQQSNGTLSGFVNDNGNVVGNDPGFESEPLDDFSLVDSSAAANQGGALAAAASGQPVILEYAKHTKSVDRATVANPDLGAFESTTTATQLSITTSTLQSGDVDESYSATLSATGGTQPYTWSLFSGSLPQGLSLGSSSGRISGTPGAAGTFSFTVRATDNAGTTANAALSIVIDEAAPPPPPPPPPPPTGGLLDNYSSKSGLSSLSYVSNDLSGITYVPETNTFFLIQNSGGRIWEVDSNFNLLRTISSGGFGDSEDIVYMGNNEFAIVVESSRLYIGTISPGVTSLNPGAFQRIEFDTVTGNSGYEGIAFDPATNRFWSVKERGPRKIVTFERPSTSSNTTITATVPFNAGSLPASDLSAVHFDSRTGNLLILSHESHKVMEVTTDGTVLSELNLSDSSQHEGLALDSNFDFLITSEPNRWRRYGQ